MDKERINDKEGICLVIAFIMGSSLILGTGGSAKNDAWIADITGFIMAVPIWAVYVRLLSLYPGQNLFDISIQLCGKIGGRILSFFFVLYAFHLGALVFRNFGEFINIIAMQEMPLIFPLLCLGAVCIYAARLGIEVLGRTCAFFITLVFLILLVVQLLAIPEIHLEHLKPVLGNGFAPILQGTFGVFAFPYAETVVFLGVFSALQTKKSPAKVFKWATVISGFIILVITIRNTTILSSMAGSYYFPSYAAVSMIKIGTFLQRIEITVSFVFFFGVFFKGTLCLLAASKGIAHIFNLKDYRSIVIQVGLLMVYFAYIVYDNSIEMNYWAFKVYPYYAFPMQVVIPVFIWILAERQNAKTKMQNDLAS